MLVYILGRSETKLKTSAEIGVWAQKIARDGVEELLLLIETLFANLSSLIKTRL